MDLQMADHVKSKEIDAKTTLLKTKKGEIEVLKKENENMGKRYAK